MSVLRVLKRDEECVSLKLDRSPFRIGRGLKADLHLADPSISKTHLILRKNVEDSSWTLQDCSQNGTQLDDQVLPQRIQAFEVHRKYRLSKLYQIELISGASRFGEREPTLVHSQRPTSLVHWNSSKESLEIQRAFLQWKTNKGERVERILYSEGISIGRHPSNDIVIPDESVSQFHARLELKNNEFHLTDLGSTNGTRLDGALVVFAQISRNSKIHLGQKEFQFLIEKETQLLREKNANHFFGLSSGHPKMKKLFSMIEAVAPTDAAVFVQGESGTGKELVARALHQLSGRAESAFVAINCAAIPKDLLESELFGHVKGAFSGATESRKGAFEEADGGTLFLDEVGELSLELQAKLLRALESGEIRPVGHDQTRLVDVRIISATHQDLSVLIKKEKFRSDLYFRLHVVPLHIPPLRERMRDLDLLIPELCKSMNLPLKWTNEARDELGRYEFPGNIRELKNILQRVAILARIDPSIDPSSESDEVWVQAHHLSFLDQIRKAKWIPKPEETAEKQKIIGALESNAFNQSKAAKDLGVAVSTLHDRIRRLRIDIPKRKKA